MREDHHSVLQRESNIQLKPSFEPNNNRILVAGPLFLDNLGQLVQQHQRFTVKLSCANTHTRAQTQRNSY